MFSHGQSSAPARTRTLDPVIKSHLLYQLSYKGGLGAMRKLCLTNSRMLATLAGVASASDL